ncbi:glycine dehydrogenase [Hyunsoonleella sp. 2307UL5-6]|uniref:glycine dehydrogenase n=1 Tax=Hyunsoonleella sp. 2307UL5-6 TaxID=3384768 RepID=UPI0039BC40B5
MSKKNKIFIPCDEANHVCDKNQYKEASLWDMIKLNIHLIYCKACRNYTANNTKLSKMMKATTNNKKVISLNNEVKSNFKNKFEEALKQEQNN